MNTPPLTKPKRNVAIPGETGLVDRWYYVRRAETNCELCGSRHANQYMSRDTNEVIIACEEHEPAELREAPWPIRLEFRQNLRNMQTTWGAQRNDWPGWDEHFSASPYEYVRVDRRQHEVWCSIERFRELVADDEITKCRHHCQLGKRGWVMFSARSAEMYAPGNCPWLEEEKTT
jgi:hypothetical protein